jgi:hypothetical protein
MMFRPQLYPAAKRAGSPVIPREVFLDAII